MVYQACWMRFVICVKRKLSFCLSIINHSVQVFQLASASVIEMHASSTKNRNYWKRNDFSYTHSEICESKNYSIVSENKLFDREEAFLSRRILVCVATICEQFPQFSSTLFDRSCETGDQPNSFMELLSLTIKNFSLYVRFG